MSDPDFNKLSLSDECFVDTPEHDIEKIKTDTIRRNKLRMIVQTLLEFNPYGIPLDKLEEIVKDQLDLKNSEEQVWWQGRPLRFGPWHKIFFFGRSHVIRASRSDGSLCLITLKIEFLKQISPSFFLLFFPFPSPISSFLCSLFSFFCRDAIFWKSLMCFFVTKRRRWFFWYLKFWFPLKRR